MKKNYTLLSGLVLASCLTFAQDKVGNGNNAEPQVQAALSIESTSANPELVKGSKFNSKAFGDTLYIQDFAGGLPTGWSVVNNNPNNFQWVWNTVYQNGQFSAATNVITSTSAANGFMALTGDFFNTPIPATGAVAMDTYFESEVIDLTNGGANPTGFGSVWVTYQQALRYCCSGANRLVLQASTDNFVTFQEYDATNAIAVNAASGTVTNVINVSTAAANSANMKVRFLSEGNSHYYWMIDDFAVIEGPENDMEIRTPYLEFNFDYGINPFYGQIPYDLFPALPMSAILFNNGSNVATGSRLEGDIFHTADPNGGPGLGLLYSTTSTPATLASLALDTVVTNSPRFVPLVLGDFRADLTANSDSIDQLPGNDTYSQAFTTTDSVMWRGDQLFGGGTGPGSYVRNGQTGGTATGDKFATLYIIESRTGNGVHTVPTSVTFAVSDDVQNIGVEIVPKIWRFEEDSATLDAAFVAEVASSFIPYTVQSTDTNSMLTLSFDNGPAVLNGMDSGAYAVGWEVTNTNGGNNFEVQNDATSAAFQDNVSCFLDFGHSPGWGWVDVNPVIMLNMGGLPITSVASNAISSTEFTIAPNPNNGLFKMTVTSKENVTYNLNVRNMLGQVVYTDAISVNGTTVENMDLTQFEKGVYFVSLENGVDKILKKVVVQ